MNDLAHNIAPVVALAPVVLSATNTSDDIDCLGYGSLTVIVSTGAVAGSGNFTVKLQHSDDPDESPPEWDDVPATGLIGEFPTALEANSVVKVGYLTAAPKRYVRAVVTKNSGTSIAASVLFIKGSPRSMPVA
jgi:hypothetical protein